MPDAERVELSALTLEVGFLVNRDDSTSAQPTLLISLYVATCLLCRVIG